MSYNKSQQNEMDLNKISDDTEDFFNLIDKLAQKEKYLAFQQFVQAYFVIRPVYQTKEIYSRDNVPQKILQHIGQPKGLDESVDGIIVTHQGTCYAYHIVSDSAGAMAPQQKQTLQTFIDLQLYVFCKIIVTRGELTFKQIGVKEITGLIIINKTQFYALEAFDIQNIKRWLQQEPLIQSRLEPQQHQREALHAIRDALSKENRTTLVMACGTGKSLIPLWYIEKQNFERILVLMPSLALVHQFIHAWLKNTSAKLLNFIAVCSDNTIRHDLDDVWEMRPEDVDFPVTTKVEDIKQFLADKMLGMKIIFSTYQSASMVKLACGKTGIDFAVFDEAHKTTGHDNPFGLALEDKNIFIKKRLFMTATPKHVSIRAKEGVEKPTLFSMDNPEYYGRTCYYLDFYNAAKRNIICDYQIIVSIITSEDLNRKKLSHDVVMMKSKKVSAEYIAKLLAIEQAVKIHKLRRIFTFHRTIKEAKKIIEDKICPIQHFLPHFEALHINGNQPSSQRNAILNKFSQSTEAILSNAHCLTEGVDVPSVDMVAFMSPKRSTLDIVQAVGRAMRMAPGKTTGFILVPLFVNVAEHESIDEAIERSDYKEVCTVVNAIAEQDHELLKIIQTMSFEKGRDKIINHDALSKKITIIGHTLQLAKLKKAISQNIITYVGTTFDERLGELARYKEEHGDCNVPQKYNKNRRLALWVSTLRRGRKRNQLSIDKIEKLDALDFDWDPMSTQFNENLNALKQFKAEFKHCNVPSEYGKNKQLGEWVATLRRGKKRNQLTVDKIEKLDVLGFDWNPFNTKFNDHLNALKQFKTEFDHCNVPKRCSKNKQLGIWMVRLRVLKKNGQLSAEKIKKLDVLGLDWDPMSTQFNDNLSALKQFKSEFGHCNVSQRCSKNKQLGIWVRRLRRERKNNQLTADKIKKLDELGFDWDPINMQFNDNLNTLKQFKAEFKHCNVPSKYSKNKQLGFWVGKLRDLKKKGQLTAEKIKELDALSFNWDPIETQFNENLNALKQFKAEFGHCNVSKRRGTNKQLGSWVIGLRKQRKESQLTADKIEKLDALGFDWDPIETKFNDNLEILKNFKIELGHYNMSSGYNKNRQLGVWVSKLRKLKKEGRLAADKIKKLDALGFDWK